MELTRQQKVFTVVGTLLGLFLAALDQTIVSTAGPAMQQDLHIAPSLYAWITTSYIVASTVAVPIWGKLSDMFGRKNILVVGIIVFLAGSVLCGLAHSTLMLLICRAIQGIGSGALFTSAFAVVADLFTPAERGKYQGVFAAAFGIASVVGPFIGGFITDNFGWHWVFLVNLPLGAIALGFIFARMPPLKQSAAKGRLDFAGAAALLVFAVPLLFALSLGRRVVQPNEFGLPWASAQIFALFGLSLAGLVSFFLIERRAADPIINLSLFTNKTFAVGNLAAFVVGATFLGAMVFLPLFMVNVVGLSATRSGVTLMPLTFGLIIGNVMSGQLASRVGRYKVFILASLVILAAAFAVLAFTLTPTSTQTEVSLKMILVGLGLGPSIPLYTLAIQNAVPPPQIGVATSSATFFRSMGSTIGIAVLGTVFATVLSSSIRRHMGELAHELPPPVMAQLAKAQSAPPDEESGPQRKLVDTTAIEGKLAPLLGAEQAHSVADKVSGALKQSLTDAVREIFVITLILAVLGLLITFTLPEIPLRKTHGPPAPAVVE